MTDLHRTPRALVVYESMFGNTAAIAQAVAQGLHTEGYDVTCTDIATIRTDIALDVDLLVVGGPTHAFSLSRPRTRADAVRQGAPPAHAATGLREWLSALPADRNSTRPPVAVFDTRISKVSHLPAAAAPAAARLLRRRGYRLLGTPTGFLVVDTAGPPCDGELDRATAWGRHLAETLRSPAKHGVSRSS